MFKVYNGAAFVVDVYAFSIEDAVAIFSGLHNYRDLPISPIARRLWKAGKFEMAQVM